MFARLHDHRAISHYRILAGIHEYDTSISALNVIVHVIYLHKIEQCKYIQVSDIAINIFHGFNLRWSRHLLFIGRNNLPSQTKVQNNSILKTTNS